MLYHTAKFGVVGPSESLRQELAPLDIGVTVLCPGAVATGIVSRTRETQPKVDLGMSDEQRKQARARSATTERWLQEGVSPDAVGDMVLDGVRGDRLYVHTDRLMAVAIEARCKALLDAMPEE